MDQIESLQQRLENAERYRKLIGIELHDGPAQQLTAALMQLQAFDAKRIGHAQQSVEAGATDHVDDHSADPAQPHFELAVELLREAIDEVRHLINGLHPPQLDSLGLGAAVAMLVRQVEDRDGLPVTMRLELGSKRPDPVIEATAYRIVQEALTNVVKHAQADRAEVTLRSDEQRLHIEVCDRGVGFDPNDIPDRCRGVGGIRQRVEMFDGRLKIESRPDRGTRISVELPNA